MVQSNDVLVERPCPVCGGRERKPHWRKRELTIVRCGSCGMIYANPVPGGMASGQFYDDVGKEFYLSPDKLESDYAEVRFERELRLFREQCPRGDVLDVGCSSGAFLFQLRKLWPADYQILGMDVSGPPLDYAESRGVPVARGNVLEAELDGRRFDAVTFWAVLEHVAGPGRFLEKAHSVLKPGGVCIVLVPNSKSLAVRLLGARYRYVYAQHLNYFSSRTLVRLAAAKFEVIGTRYTHFNPVVIWHDWRDRGRDVSNVERAKLLKRTTAYKQKAWMKPVKAAYGIAERALAGFALADNVVLVLRKRP